MNSSPFDSDTAGTSAHGSRCASSPLAATRLDATSHRCDIRSCSSYSPAVSNRASSAALARGAPENASSISATAASVSGAARRKYSNSMRSSARWKLGSTCASNGSSSASNSVRAEAGRSRCSRSVAASRATASRRAAPSVARLAATVCAMHESIRAACAASASAAVSSASPISECVSRNVPSACQPESGSLSRSVHHSGDAVVGQAVELRGDLVRCVAGVERQPVFVRARAHADERRAGLVVDRVDDEARRLITLKCPEFHGDPQWKMRGSGALSSA